MKNRIPVQLTATLVLLFASPTRAQHVDIWAYNADGKIGVGEYNFDSLSATERRVHLARFDSFYSVNNPGFTSLAGPESLPGSQELSWEFLPMTVDSGPHAGYRSTLLYWDGTGESPTFGPTPTEDYEFSVFGIYGSAKATGTDEVEAGSVIAPTPPNGSIHEHPYYFLDDNGDGLNTTLPEAGVYLIGLRLLIEGLEDSDPLFMVWATPEISVLPTIQPAASWVNERVDSLFVDLAAGDFDSDNNVDGADFLLWQRDQAVLGGATALSEWEVNFGSGLASPIVTLPVPEPTSSRCLVWLLAVMQSGWWRQLCRFDRLEA